MRFLFDTVRELVPKQLSWASERKADRIAVATRRIAEFTLLLAAGEFDFAEPMVNEFNGEMRFEQRVEPSTQCLLEWASIENRALARRPPK